MYNAISSALRTKRTQQNIGKIVGALLGSSALLTSVTTPVGAIQTQSTQPEDVLFEADELTRRSDTGLIYARGNVRAHFGDQLLVSEEVQYNPETDIVIAKGNVSITDSAGEVYYADEVELTGDLADGIATNFAALLADDSRIAGSSVIKSQDGNNELSNAVYTACTICEESEVGDDKPTWLIKASEIKQDKSQNVIKFNNAVIEAFGIPVFYSPYMQIPDPSVERQSGLLVPDFGTSSVLGTFAEIPYYFAISDHQDATFSPKFMSDQGMLLQGEYRLKTARGNLTVQAGVIDQSDDQLSDTDVERITSLGGASSIQTTTLPSGETISTFDTPNLGFHLFGKGDYQINDQWSTDFDIDHVSDKIYLRTYKVAPEGDLQSTEDYFRPDRLRSAIAVRRKTDNSLLKVEGLAFNSLRLSEDNDFTAQALPRISYQKTLQDPYLKGDTSFNVDFISITRERGVQTTRLTTKADWQKNLTTGNGHRFSLFGELRGDFYRYDDVTQGIESCNPDNLTAAAFAECSLFLPDQGLSDSVDEERFLPTVGIGWSYPLAKQTENATFILEPQIQFVASPDLENDQQILNEDSQFFEFDTTTLHQWSKSSGYDVWEDGQRVNLGIALSAFWNNDFAIKGSLGQQYRLEDSTAFSLNTGLNETSSDIVGTFEMRFGKRFNWNNRFRYDQNDKEAKRLESQLAARQGPLTANVTYLRLLTDDPVQTVEEDEFLSVSASYKFNENWRLGARVRRDLSDDFIATGEIRDGFRIFTQEKSAETVEKALSLSYEDECTNISLIYQNDLTRQISSGGDEQLTLQIQLARFK